jgi:hypothetical protein
MATRDKNETSGLSLIDAVEALSSIADMELDRDIGIAQRHDLILQETPFTYRTVHWLHRQGADETVLLVKDIFRVILNYLRQFYNKEYRAVTQPQAIEGIKTIMVLVGEAAKKLDRYSGLFHKIKEKSVTQLKEYQQLQEFYQTRIARRVDEGVLGKWLLELTKRAWTREGRFKFAGKPITETKHAFVDLESVRKDSDYELLLLRKEDGTRFYSPRLIRNIKLVCDFGDYFPGAKAGPNPVEDVAIWQDRVLHGVAKEILGALGNRLHRFYRESLRLKEKEFVEDLNKALMALMLAANPQNLKRGIPKKSCKDYFVDFQHYLRAALRTDDYHKLITYPPKPTNQIAQGLLEMVHGLCLALFESLHPIHEVNSFVLSIIQEAKERLSPEHEKAARESHALWSGLSCDETALVKSFKHHESGPLNLMLETLQEGGLLSFDPIAQHHLPCHYYALGLPDGKVSNIQLPSPTGQEMIHKAAVVDEFKAYLRACLKHHFLKKHLLINLQDRTSWKEHARSAALEELQHLEEFDGAIAVVTLAKDTEFYHQLAPYSQENHADLFFQTFKDHLQDSNAGFYFPMAISKQLFPHFTDGVIEAIHRVFFSGRNVLSREHRLDFIELFYLFLQLKLIEICKPDSFSLTCKDGVDTGPAASVQLLAFMKLISPEPLSNADRDSCNLLLHAPALLLRQRPIQPERFNRMVSALKCVESVRSQLGDESFALVIQDAFGDYYRSHLLKARVMP